jgi:predicted TIM-barrel fold metal-dependent hydrolase
VKTIDIHAHWFPPEWVRLMEREAERDGILGRNAARLLGLG